MSFYLIVISTFEENFLQINKIRRKQCRQYNIPVLFCYNGKIPEGFQFQEDELYIEEPSNTGPYPINPVMFVKFQTAVKEFYKRMEKKPDFFIRCTATCFIDFKNVYKVLRTIPLRNSIAGIYDSKYEDILFCNGTCMIISNDVAKQLSEEPIDTSLMPIIENDDVVISWLGSKYAILMDLIYWFAHYENLTSKLEQLNKHPTKTVFYRIKNPADRMNIDVGIWKLLHDKIDN